MFCKPYFFRTILKLRLNISFTEPPIYSVPISRGNSIPDSGKGWTYNIFVSLFFPSTIKWVISLSYASAYLLVYWYCLKKYPNINAVTTVGSKISKAFFNITFIVFNLTPVQKNKVQKKIKREKLVKVQPRKGMV